MKDKGKQKKNLIGYLVFFCGMQIVASRHELVNKREIE